MDTFYRNVIGVCLYFEIFIYNLTTLLWNNSFILSILVNLLQGLCPGLNHGQKFGILYVYSTDEQHHYETKKANKNN